MKKQRSNGNFSAHSVVNLVQITRPSLTKALLPQANHHMWPCSRQGKGTITRLQNT